MTTTERSTIGQLLDGLPTNWGRWGKNDQVGGLNFLDEREVSRGVAAIRSHRPFTLALTMNHPQGDPVWPGRSGAVKLMTQDAGSYTSGKLQKPPGGLQYADDFITMYLQGSTQFDALGHTWYDGQLYNGYDESTTLSGMGEASVLPLAEKGATGHAVLLDVARHRGRKRLDKGEGISLADLLACAKAQGVTLQKRDILLVRTGWLTLFYDEGAARFYEPPFLEPGLAFSRELVEWFHEMEIPLLGSDSIANELTFDPSHGVILPLHGALMRNLGVVFNEILWLEELGADCARDGQYSFLYTAAPLKIDRAAGAPVNPIVIK